MENTKYTAPAAVAKNAKKGLKLREAFHRGGTNVGITRAHQLSEQKPIDISIIKRMVSYFARHEVDKKGENFGNEDSPSNGYIAWLLWGGDEGKKWAEAEKKKFEEKSEK